VIALLVSGKSVVAICHAPIRGPSPRVVGRCYPRRARPPRRPVGRSWLGCMGTDSSPTECRRHRRKATHKQRPARRSTTPTAVGAQSSPIPTTRPRKLQTACLPRAGGKERVTPRADTPPYTEGRSPQRPVEWKKKPIHTGLFHRSRD